MILKLGTHKIIRVNNRFDKAKTSLSEPAGEFLPVRGLPRKRSEPSKPPAVDNAVMLSFGTLIRGQNICYYFTSDCEVRVETEKRIRAIRIALQKKTRAATVNAQNTAPPR